MCREMAVRIITEVDTTTVDITTVEIAAVVTNDEIEVAFPFGLNGWMLVKSYACIRSESYYDCGLWR